MSLREQFSEALKESMRAKDARRVSTLRLILAALKDRDIAARTEDRTQGVTDDEILQMLAKMIKQRVESIDTYRAAGRTDLVQQEEEEKAIIESFMPRQMSAAEVEQAVAAAAAELGATGLKDMGRVMAALKERFAGRMDFSQASALAKAVLTKGPA